MQPQERTTFETPGTAAAFYRPSFNMTLFSSGHSWGVEKYLLYLSQRVYIPYYLGVGASRPDVGFLGPYSILRYLDSGPSG